MSAKSHFFCHSLNKSHGDSGLSKIEPFNDAYRTSPSTSSLPTNPRELSGVTSEYVESAVFYTDGSLIEGSTGFAIHRTGVGGFGFKLSSPVGVFSAELSALFMALRHIREVIQPPETQKVDTSLFNPVLSEISISKHSPGLQKCTLNVLSLFFPSHYRRWLFYIFAFCTK
jgi:hypothetical protein